jgi:hypothetical protein
MRIASCIAVVLSFAATPAFATGTILCRSTTSPTDGPSLALTGGRGTGIVRARLTQNGAGFTTGAGAGAPVIAQAWVDDWQLKLDIVDANADGRIARLDTRRRAGSSYTGILIYRGRTWRVRCQEG